jgi:DNA-binding PadR family transcriptional regulator
VASHRLLLTVSADAAVRGLRGRPAAAWGRLEPELKAQGCRAAGYRLLAGDGGWSSYCCKHLHARWRVIRRSSRGSTRFFWPTSLAQVYPELARLADAGLLTRREDSHGARERFAYELTGEGHAALLAWLCSAHQAPTQFRDEGVLRLLFADALAGEDQLALVRRLRERARRASAHMREEILPLAETLDATRYPALVARLGADTYAFAERWLAEVEGDLEG